MTSTKQPTRQTIKRRNDRRLADDKAGFQRCRYKTGTCTNERARKPNDMYHSLCEKHRLLHNFNQRNFDRKKRAIRKLLEEEDTPSSPSSSVSTSTDDDDLEVAVNFEPLMYPQSHVAAPRWTDEDLYILKAFLN
ncbi:hypothetical protein SPRG_14802 [Saprolegnia parasitica CBS 223.65]|uniref:Uncharacterized protein n=1 Tax=Saprolegnia parasitica (strain CBS 223.65) TaxID=695850 RepID=A0A067BQB1_SAPPC|nr:hypothetical protein SPRG_14802 [Saprolegnia parasitica CBS 223.65]KDO18965.1 hypothetical protein SPRG_14802 [Saprolegnia parasitica CBS 223.65]|eukprot:XP_012210313.1 hypothetical protein SPRG_14802 [Saprolegnia parasitica CBS 223.65]